MGGETGGPTIYYGYGSSEGSTLRTRTRTNTNPNGTEANAAGRSVRRSFRTIGTWEGRREGLLSTMAMAVQRVAHSVY